MKYALIADIKTEQCTHVACLGDIVGYNADPKKCLDIIRAMNIPCVKGNHDEYCANDKPLEGFNPHAAEKVEWTRKQLTDDDKRWLSALEYIRIIDGFTIVHATLDQPERWQYVFEKNAAASCFIRQTTPVCFFGHTHVPVAFIRDTMVRGGTYSKFRVKPGPKYFIGVGAVGQPRDHNPKAAYVTYDLNEHAIELRRVEYDTGGAQKKNRDAGLI